MIKIILLASTLMLTTSPVFAEIGTGVDSELDPCAEYKTNSEIYACLNEYAKSLMAEGSDADNLYQEKLAEYVRNFGLAESNIFNYLKPQPLSKINLLVLEKGDVEVSASGECFDFEQLQKTGHYVAPGVIQTIKRQLRETAMFLAEFHGKNLGSFSSAFFQIREAKLCSKPANKHRNLLFRKRVLHVGVEMSRTDWLTHDELKNEWMIGNALLDKPLTKLDQSMPTLSKILSLFKDDKRKKLLSFWWLVNPMGTPRFYMRNLILPKVLKLVGKLNQGVPHNMTAKDYLLSKVDAPTYPKGEHKRELTLYLESDPALADAILSRWQTMMSESAGIESLIDGAFDFGGSSKGVKVLAGRQKGPISVRNHHIISAFINATAGDRQLLKETSQQQMYAEFNGTLKIDRTFSDGSSVHIECSNHPSCFEDAIYDLQEMLAGIGVDTNDIIDAGINFVGLSPSRVKTALLVKAIEAELR